MRINILVEISIPVFCPDDEAACSCLPQYMMLQPTTSVFSS